MTCLACKEPLDRAYVEGTKSQLHPTCEPNPDLVLTDIFGIISDALTNDPRSKQTRIGPSEMGNPCDRRIGYHLAGITKANKRGNQVAWKPAIGTAVHSMFADIFSRDELARFNADTNADPRWYVEDRLNVGSINDTDIDGSCDLFDAWTGGVIDWKFTTRNMIREKYRPHGPGDQYRTQAHLYGRGWQRRGFTPRWVAIVFMTRDGEFTDRHVWHENYDEQIALNALDRVASIGNALQALGPDFVIPTLPATEAHCNYCPWFASSSSNLAKSCPGINITSTTSAAFNELLPETTTPAGGRSRTAA